MPRRLGQHFLRPASAARLVESIAPRRDDVFLEIGPGKGALTLPLAARCREVVAVELDAGLAERLRRTAPDNVRIVQGDALRVDLASLVPRGGRLAANLPYYISSPLLRRFLDLRGHLHDVHVMVQDEVASRVASPPGSKQYGILSVLYALFADVSVVMRLPPGAFTPPPKVSSAVLRVLFLSEPRAQVADLTAFEDLVRKAFSRRRRTLENNLQDSYANLKENLRLLNIAGSRRAETLPVGDFARLYSVLTRR
ncbi:MAG TPA: 16S rRNA (adenine(1518)-N(6)/adenine(1519)-N(6))-dimethyltransferase RsmA [Vicinamibacteria bacterium]|nr:16S rRNA (adenine(1518)-N(6)/adenine(1519)-N(6))-dimethyltransferase RsmA [Vicinamibacteria bacterium]